MYRIEKGSRCLRAMGDLKISPYLIDRIMDSENQKEIKSPNQTKETLFILLILLKYPFFVK